MVHVWLIWEGGGRSFEFHSHMAIYGLDIWWCHAWDTWSCSIHHMDTGRKRDPCACSCQFFRKHTSNTTSKSTCCNDAVIPAVGPFSGNHCKNLEWVPHVAHILHKPSQSWGFQNYLDLFRIFGHISVLNWTEMKRAIEQHSVCRKLVHASV